MAALSQRFAASRGEIGGVCGRAGEILQLIGVGRGIEELRRVARGGDEFESRA